MLCLSGFELYSRWVPLKAVIISEKTGVGLLVENRGNNALSTMVI